MMGVDPYVFALRHNANIIIAGRSSDCAIYAALLMKVLIQRLLGTRQKYSNVVLPPLKLVPPQTAFFLNSKKQLSRLSRSLKKDLHTTSVAAHSLYENANPFELIEPDGVLKIAGSQYHAVNSRRVRVSNSSFEPKTIKNAKLEGAIFLGYQSVIIGGIRDPLIIGQIDDWTAETKKTVKI